MNAAAGVCNATDVSHNAIGSRLPCAQAALIFLHGSGDSGPGIRQWLSHASGGAFEDNLRAAGVQLFCPSAPARPYTLAGGNPQTVWFDRKTMAYEVPEDVDGVKISVEQIDSQVDELLTSGIPLERIAVAGMSMGGCLALHVGLGVGRHACKLGAVACLSAFLPKDSALDTVASARAVSGFEAGDTVPVGGPPLFMAHGAVDQMVSPSWAQATRTRLEAIGLQTPADVVVFEGLGHDMCRSELLQLANFIIKHVGCLS